MIYSATCRFPIAVLRVVEVDVDRITILPPPPPSPDFFSLPTILSLTQ